MNRRKLKEQVRTGQITAAEALRVMIAGLKKDDAVFKTRTYRWLQRRANVGGAR